LDFLQHTHISPKACARSRHRRRHTLDHSRRADHPSFDMLVFWTCRALYLSSHIANPPGLNRAGKRIQLHFVCMRTDFTSPDHTCAIYVYIYIHIYTCMPRAVDGVTRLSGGAASCFPTAAPLQSRPGVAVGGKSRESAAVGRVPEVVLNYTCMFFFFCILAFSCFLLLLPQTRVGVSSGRRSSSTRPALLHSSFHRARREIRERQWTVERKRLAWKTLRVSSRIETLKKTLRAERLVGHCVSRRGRAEAHGEGEAPQGVERTSSAPSD